MHVCSLIYHYKLNRAIQESGICQQQLIGDYGTLTVMKPCPVVLLANATNVERSFTKNCNHKHTYRHAQAQTYIYTHTMTWSWSDLDEIQATPWDMWHSLQPIRSTQVCMRQLTWLMFPLRFRNDKMVHCHISNGSCDWPPNWVRKQQSSYLCSPSHSHISETSFPWMPL